MVLTLHYRCKREFSKPVFFLLDFLDKLPLLGTFFKVGVRRYDIEPYELTLNLDKIKTEMFIDNKSQTIVSEMKFSDLKEVVYDYNKKYESFAAYPTMATFYQKSDSSSSQKTLRVPLSKRSDFFSLKRELTSMDVSQRNNIRIKVWVVVFGALAVGVLASYIIGPVLVDLVFSYFKTS